MEIIKVKDLTFRYHGDNFDAVSDVSVSVEEGAFVCVLGHNGSGKSTLAKHLNAVLLPTSGSVTVDGIDTTDEAQTFELRRRAGMVFQNPDNQIVATIVEEDVAFGLENLGIDPPEIRKRVDDALDAVGMRHLAEHAPHQLSGGQKQRIAIAGIIAMRPRVIILDEPTAMLDPKGRREVMETIKELNEKFGVTIVLITHFMDEAAQSDKVFVMDKGKLILEGTPSEVFSHGELLRSVGLDVPPATEISLLLRNEGIALPDNILTEEQCVDEIVKIMRNS